MTFTGMVSGPNGFNMRTFECALCNCTEKVKVPRPARRRTGDCPISPDLAFASGGSSLQALASKTTSLGSELLIGRRIGA
jgi:hypothetical protein